MNGDYFFTKQQIIKLHAILIADTGGSGGLRDIAALESALAAPYQTFDGDYLFPTIEEKAARLGFGLTRNHPFVDGNKRIGAHAMLVLLKAHGIRLSFSQKELSSLFYGIASGKTGYSDLIGWVLKHSKNTSSENGSLKEPE